MERCRWQKNKKLVSVCGRLYHHKCVALERIAKNNLGREIKLTRWEDNKP